MHTHPSVTAIDRGHRPSTHLRTLRTGLRLGVAAAALLAGTAAEAQQASNTGLSA